jgi:hypothetical protein
MGLMEYEYKGMAGRVHLKRHYHNESEIFGHF